MNPAPPPVSSPCKCYVSHDAYFSVKLNFAMEGGAG